MITSPNPKMSSFHPEDWRGMLDLSTAFCRFVHGQVSPKFLKRKLLEFVKKIPKHDANLAADCLNTFASSCLPENLVLRYLSPDEPTKQCAEDLVQTFINAIRVLLPEQISSQSVPILMKFCELFRRYATNNDPMYKFCRNNLVVVGNYSENYNVGDHKFGLMGLEDVCSFAFEIVRKVSDGLIASMESVNSSGPETMDLDCFRVLLRKLRALVEDELPLPLSRTGTFEYGHLTNVVRFLVVVFDNLWIKLLMCLDVMEDSIKEKKENDGWSQYLVILKELHDISKLQEGKKEDFWDDLRGNKLSLCHLIVRYAGRGEDYEWIIEHGSDLLDFESRRHLVKLLLPEVNDEHEDDAHEMVIDRSQLLVESFEYIACADPSDLRFGLYLEFKNEEATGPGVLREWFFLVCQELFSLETSLFISCPNDCRRFFPNPASKAEPKLLEYYNFAGRVIALALMYEVQVGITFDRSFLLQLAGNEVSLEDIKDADPFLYSSCQKILEMDPMEIDQDTLGLTFVWDIQASGSMEVVELCPDGKNITVNSGNRNEYVDLVIQYRFMTSISEQTSHFAQGFTDVVGEERIQKICFRSLELEDFDGMLYGIESGIDLQDWKKHTDLHGCLETDPHICWFWKIVEKMSPEQRKVLLFFWTSINNLPVEGFSGLPSRLNIHRSNESIHHLPSSHTCVYQLSIPAYPSMAAMQERLNIITQDYVGYGFGTS